MKYVEKTYGVNAKEAERLLKVERCEICGQTLGLAQRRAIDHDHRTKKVRGVLCHYCNRFVLGAIEKAAAVSGKTLPEYLKSLEAYLKKHYN